MFLHKIIAPEMLVTCGIKWYNTTCACPGGLMDTMLDSDSGDVGSIPARDTRKSFDFSGLF